MLMQSQKVQREGSRMKTLSVRQPWAWLIAHRFKPLENRTWDTKVRGLILIHSSKLFDKEGYA